MRADIIMEKWLEINGRKLLARTLIAELDWSFKGIVPGKANYMAACQMLYGVQLAADAYRGGSIEIDEKIMSKIEEEQLSVPADNRLPGAIY